MSFWETVGRAIRGEKLVSEDEIDSKLQKALADKDEEVKKFLVSRGRAEHKPNYNKDELTNENRSWKPVGFSNEFLRQVYRTSPMLRSVIDIRKREVASCEWAVMPCIKKHTEELNFLQRTIRSVQRYQDLSYLVDMFNPMFLEKQMCADLIKSCRSNEDITDWEIKSRFQIARDMIYRQAEVDAFPLNSLLQNPHPNMSLPQILASIVPDILVLDSGCIEAVREELPYDLDLYEISGGKEKRPKSTNPIGRLVPVDGATIVPVLDRFGMPADYSDSSRFAYEQWIEHQHQASFRTCDMLRIVENPQTDVHFRGRGFSRTESLVITMSLDLMSDNADMEEKRRAMYGGFLNIKDESLMEEDLAALRMDIAEQLEGKKKLPILSFDDIKFERVTGETNFGAVNKEKRDLYISRLCAAFEIGKTKLGIYDNANRSTSENSKELTDDGLKHLLQVIDDHMTSFLIGRSGKKNIKYVSNPSHGRDESAEREAVKEELESCLITVNDARIRMGYEPVEGGDCSIHYLKKRDEFKGQTEGQASANVDGPMDDQDNDGLNDELEELVDDGSFLEDDENEMNKSLEQNEWPELEL